MQGAGAPHAPVAPHVSTWEVSLHIVALGAHVPPQLPPDALVMHTYWHGDELPHVPPAAHVSTPLFAHWVAIGEHDPAHAPAVQTFGQAAPLFCQAPVASHFCGCRFEH